MIKFYNSLSRKKETLRPIKKGGVKMFVCGITSYDFSHIGHARTYIVFDLIAKYLRKKGYDVFYLQNITDIDDKIIEGAKKEKTSWQKLSRQFEKEYLKEMEVLKIDSVTKYARATTHLKEIISQVKRLLEKGFTYQTEDGIYYDISKFKDYGKLSKRTVLQAEDGVSRIDESIGKRNKGDFCLWKFSKPGEPSWKWPAPKGRGSPRHMAGRPGWHIEDTAITEKYFGPQYDIHGGGRDLMFPHHEAEIAQMEAISGKKPLVKCWLHTGFLTVKKTKMAKSLGNFITIRDFLKKYSVRELRFFVTKTHYRSPLDYSEKEMEQAKNQLERIDEFVEKLTTYNLQLTTEKRTFKSLILQTEKDFDSAMADDFNTPKAISVIFEMIRQVNPLLDKNEVEKKQIKEILKFLKEIDEVFNFIFRKKPKEKIPEEIQKLAKKREEYRKERNFSRADEIREKIKKRGFWLEDTKSGPKIKKL